MTISIQLKIVVFICLGNLILNFSLYGQATSQNTLKNGNGVKIFYDEPLIGFPYDMRDTVKQNKIRRIINYENGLKNGAEIQFWNYPLDTASLFHFLDDYLHGEYFKQYKATGVLERGKYLFGKQVNQEFRDSMGNLMVNVKFRKDSIRNLYYINDTLCNGHYKTYYLDDHLDVKLEEYMQTFNGEYPFKKGAVKQDIYFTKGKCDSIIRYAFAVFGIASVVKNDYVNYIRTYTNYNGKNIRWIYTYKIIKDKDHGNETTIYDKYLKHGIFREFYPDGTIKNVYQCKNDKLNGEYLHYDESGALTKTEHYRDDILIK